MLNEINYWVEKLGLQLHPEGGWFKETYRADEEVANTHLPSRFTGSRSFSTAIYFLLAGTNFSAFHRIKSDEVWHFYKGHALNIYVISPEGDFELIKLGPDIEAGQHFQAVVKAGSWFASAVEDERTYALVGCTVAPGFDFTDFEMASKEELLQAYPEHETWIKKFCRE